MAAEIFDAKPTDRSGGKSFGGDLLVDRFRSLTTLSDVEMSLLRVIQLRGRRSYRPGDFILRLGGEMQGASFIVSGWAAEVRELKDGRRLILNLLLPGDPVGLSLHSNSASPVSIEALTPVSVVDAREMSQAWHERERVSGLARGLDLIAAEFEWFRVAQAVRLGRQTARERFAHLMLELHYRLAARSMAADGEFPLPLTQEILADAIGLSVVHVNRTLQALRVEELVVMKRGRMRLSKMEALQTEGEFVKPFHV